MNTRDINSALSGKRGFYSREKRAGFNFAKDLVKLIETLKLDDVEFITGMQTVLTTRLKGEEDHGKDMSYNAGNPGSDRSGRLSGESG